jgi:hypothetical protein
MMAVFAVSEIEKVDQRQPKFPVLSTHDNKICDLCRFLAIKRSVPPSFSFNFFFFICSFLVLKWNERRTCRNAPDIHSHDGDPPEKEAAQTDGAERLCGADGQRKRTAISLRKPQSRSKQSERKNIHFFHHLDPFNGIAVDRYFSDIQLIQNF